MQPVIEASTPKRVEIETHLSSQCITEEEDESSRRTVTSGGTDMITMQLDMFSSRKSSLGTNGHNRGVNDYSYFNKLTSAYHQAAATANTTTKSSAAAITSRSIKPYRKIPSPIGRV